MWTLRVGLPYMVRELGLIGLWKLVNGYASKNMLNPAQNMDLAITKTWPICCVRSLKKNN